MGFSHNSALLPPPPRPSPPHVSTSPWPSSEWSLYGALYDFVSDPFMSLESSGSSNFCSHVFSRAADKGEPSPLAVGVVESVKKEIGDKRIWEMDCSLLMVNDLRSQHP